MKAGRQASRTLMDAVREDVGMALALLVIGEGRTVVPFLSIT